METPERGRSSRSLRSTVGVRLGGYAARLGEAVSALSRIERTSEGSDAVGMASSALRRPVAGERRLATVLAATGTGYWEMDLASMSVTWTPEMERIWGLEEGVGTRPYSVVVEHVHPDDRAGVDAAIDPNSREAFAFEYRIVRPCGEVRWMSSRGYPVVDADGSVSGWCGIAWDSTGERIREAEVFHQEARYEQLLAAMREGVVAVDRHDVITWVNDAASMELGYSREELIGANAHELFHHSYPDGSPYPIEECAIARSDRSEPRRNSEVFWRKDGTAFNVEWSSAVVESSEEFDRLVVFRDVTDRVHAEAALLRSETLRRTILDATDDLVATTTLEGSVVYASPSFDRVLGWSPDELVGTSMFDLIHPDDHAASRAAVEATIGGDPVSVTKRLRKRDGEWLSVEGKFAVADGGPDQPPIIVGTNRDMTSRLATEQALRESETRFRAVFESSMEGMCLCDEDVRFVDLNEAACAIFGRAREEVVGRRVEQVSTAEGVSAPGWQEFLEVGTREGEWMIRRPDGSERIVEYEATADVLPGLHLAMLNDITERKLLEEELRQAQKLEAVGRLAGGVAHDFNNMLTAIFGLNDQARGHLGRGEIDAATADLDQLETAAAGARDLTQQLLAFARRQALAPKVVRVDETLDGIVPLLRRIIGDDVELDVTCDDTESWIKIDPGALQQVLVNLAVNARDAMPEGGTITITSELRDGREHSAGLYSADSGRHLELTVTDTGCGIHPDVLPHIFDPFYTTKDVGEGTGLGLSTVHGIINQSGGGIDVRSAPGEGPGSRSPSRSPSLTPTTRRSSPDPNQRASLMRPCCSSRTSRSSATSSPPSSPTRASPCSPPQHPPKHSNSPTNILSTSSSPTWSCPECAGTTSPSGSWRHAPTSAPSTPPATPATSSAASKAAATSPSSKSPTPPQNSFRPWPPSSTNTADARSNASPAPRG